MCGDKIWLDHKFEKFSTVNERTRLLQVFVNFSKGRIQTRVEDTLPYTSFKLLPGMNSPLEAGVWLWQLVDNKLRTNRIKPTPNLGHTPSFSRSAIFRVFHAGLSACEQVVYYSLMLMLTMMNDGGRWWPVDLPDDPAGYRARTRTLQICVNKQTLERQRTFRETWFVVFSKEISVGQVAFGWAQKSCLIT